MTWTTPKNFDDAQRLAMAISKSAFCPSGADFPTVLCIIMAGSEIGLQPMAAVRGSWMMKGRPAWKADVIVAMAKRHPDCASFRLVSSDDAQATYETQRCGDAAPTCLTFTMAMAESAGFTKKNQSYRLHPSAMLRARCAARLASTVYPDALFGLGNDVAGVEYVAMEPTPKQLEETPETKALPAPKPEPLTEELGVAMAKGFISPNEAAKKAWEWLVRHGFYTAEDAHVYKAAIDKLVEDVGSEPTHEDVGRLWAQLTQPVEG